MKKTLLLLLPLLFFVSCGDDDETVITGPVEVPSEIAPELIEVTEACHLFSAEHNSESDLLRESFSKVAEDCDNEVALHENKEAALMKGHAFFQEFVQSYNEEAHKSCRNLAKRVIKKSYNQFLRERLEQTPQRVAYAEMDKVTFDNTMRVAIARGCISDFESIDYSFNDNDFSYSIGDEHLVNGSFEYFRIQGESGYQTLGNDWALVESKFMPFWRAFSVVEEEGKKCDFFEVQGVGVSTVAADGNHVVELDSHCQNESGQYIAGDARIEIRQSVSIKETGDYKLTFKAQKRGGVHGDLEVAIFQRSRDKEFEAIALDNSQQWQEVCVDFNAEDELKSVAIAVRDAEEAGANSMGALVDNFSFSAGTCP
jgi:hypothetical protein